MDPYKKCFCFGAKIVLLTNRQQFSMVCTLIDHKNNLKSSKLKWNHRPWASGFTAKFEHFNHFEVQRHIVQCLFSHLVKTLSAIPKLLTVNNNTVSTNLEEVSGSSS